MRIGQVFRYTRTKNRSVEIIDGLPNFFFYTDSPGNSYVQLTSGINPIGKEKGDKITPAILVSSSPHKAGSAETPWQNFFAPERGHIRYSGDNKNLSVKPENKKGIKALLRQFEMHDSQLMSDRLKASPIIFFKKVSYGGRLKGNYEFNGYGIVTGAKRVIQFNKASNSNFVNYVFDFLVFDMMAENEDFSWNWINSRRDVKVSTDVSMKVAPFAWQEWVKHGSKSVDKLRRQVAKHNVLSTEEQRPLPESSELKYLKAIYSFYSYSSARKKRFENLAMIVTAHVIKKNSGQYKSGWITKGAGDSGIDFVGRLDIGVGFGRAKLIVLGQAKCEKLDSATSGNHIARLVAKLKRGWLGVYVTTSYFSKSVQIEILEDKYPLLLINGLIIANSVREIILADGYKSIDSYLCEIDSQYESQVRHRDPEEILME